MKEKTYLGRRPLLPSWICEPITANSVQPSSSTTCHRRSLRRISCERRRYVVCATDLSLSLSLPSKAMCWAVNFFPLTKRSQHHCRVLTLISDGWKANRRVRPTYRQAMPTHSPSRRAVRPSAQWHAARYALSACSMSCDACMHHALALRWVRTQ